jgi:hypothetical protein
MEKCLIERTKRSRVHGDGPSRRELKVFEKIGTLPDSIVRDLIELTESYQGNDLGGDNYEISKHCNFKQTFNAIDQKYRQILLQSKNPNSNTHTDEYAYSDWAEYTPSSLVKFINDEIGNVYRFRLSVMAPGHELNWHIDADPSVICRAQICLSESDSCLEFKTKNDEFSLKMNVGDIYFINTGWSHRVVNKSENIRKVGIFGFKFSEIFSDIQKKLYI